MTPASTWTYPTSVVIGPGTLEGLVELCVRAGGRRPLVVTDPGVAAQPFFVQAALALERAYPGAAVFPDVAPNPTLDQVRRGATRFTAGGFDLVVAIGGGSAMDAAKGISLAAGDPARLDAFEWSVAASCYRLPLDFPVLDLPALIAVPTTAGTGSELGREAVLLDEAAGVKRVLTHPQLLPVCVILDPCVTMGLPPALTAATGMDALTHHLEAFFSPLDHPLSDGVALEGIRLVNENLEAAFRDGRDLAAREAMLKASALGAVAFQKGLGAVHALAHAIGARHGLHHGLLNAVLLPYVMRANAPAIGPRAARVAHHLGLPGASAQALLQRVLALRSSLGIPPRLADLGLRGDDADRIGAAALADRSSSDTNPRPLDAAGYAAIYRAAVDGRLEPFSPSGSPA